MNATDRISGRPCFVRHREPLADAHATRSIERTAPVLADVLVVGLDRRRRSRATSLRDRAPSRSRWRRSCVSLIFVLVARRIADERIRQSHHQRRAFAGLERNAVQTGDDPLQQRLRVRRNRTRQASTHQSAARELLPPLPRHRAIRCCSVHAANACAPAGCANPDSSSRRNSSGTSLPASRGSN